MRMLTDRFLQTQTQSPISHSFFFWRCNQDLFYPLYLLEQSAVMLCHTHIIVLRLPESDIWLILCGHRSALNWIVRWRQSSGKQQTLQQESKMRQKTTQAKGSDQTYWLRSWFYKPCLTSLPETRFIHQYMVHSAGPSLMKQVLENACV